MRREGAKCEDQHYASYSLILYKIEGAWLYEGSFPGLDEAWDKKKV